MFDVRAGSGENDPLQKLILRWAVTPLLPSDLNSVLMVEYLQYSSFCFSMHISVGAFRRLWNILSGI
jgi:hypothetical protein